MYKPVLVTGASSGIGEATAVYLAQRGFKVYAAARDHDRLAALSGLGGGHITPLVMDVIDPPSIDHALAKITDDGAPLFGLVHAAGQYMPGPVEMLSDNEWRAVLETNLFGALNILRGVLPSMRQAQLGRIVVVSAMSGAITRPFEGAFAASKRAVEACCDSLRQECAPFGVKVSVVRPNVTDTPGLRAAITGDNSDIADQAPYRDALLKMKAWQRHQSATMQPASYVSGKIYAALTSASPKAYYFATAKDHLLAAWHHFLPHRVSDSAFRRQVGLD